MIKIKKIKTLILPINFNLFKKIKNKYIHKIKLKNLMISI